MTATRFSIQSQRPEARLPALRERLPDLGFPLRLVGQSQAAIVPQRVGDWWMVPLQPSDVLPTRARQRLASVLEAGVTPKAVVLFHEIGAKPRPITRWTRQATRLILWAQQDLPATLETASNTIRVYAPPVGKFLFKTSTLVTGALAFVIWKLLTVAAVAAVADPCLVLVTEDGAWLEIDRWDD